MDLPAYAREAFRSIGLKDFLREYYYTIIDKVLREAGDATDFVFKPLVLPETIEDVNARSEANDVIVQIQEKRCSHHQGALECSVESGSQQCSFIRT